MDLVFDVARMAGRNAFRLVDEVCCPGCGTVLMRGRVTLDSARLPDRVICLECGIDAIAGNDNCGSANGTDGALGRPLTKTSIA